MTTVTLMLAGAARAAAVGLHVAYAKTRGVLIGSSIALRIVNGFR